MDASWGALPLPFAHSKTRITVDDAYVEARTATHKKHGIFFGVW